MFRIIAQFTGHEQATFIKTETKLDAHTIAHTLTKATNCWSIRLEEKNGQKWRKHFEWINQQIR
jgi:hypothetical protein